jgi:hypothetical protein
VTGSVFACGYVDASISPLRDWCRCFFSRTAWLRYLRPFQEAKPFRRAPRLKRGRAFFAPLIQAPRQEAESSKGGRASLLLDWFTFALETPLISQTGRSEEKASPPIEEPRNSKRQSQQSHSKSRPLQRRDWSGRFLFFGVIPIDDPELQPIVERYGGAQRKPFPSR